jgi:hypothetical protein
MQIWTFHSGLAVSFVSVSLGAGTLIGGPFGIVLDENTLFGYPF